MSIGAHNTSPVQTALVTGASDGIGLELAKLFARDGYRVIMVADHREKLESAAHQVRLAGSALIDVIEADLSDREGARMVYATVQQMGIRVDVLVNNAGKGVYGEFHATSLAEELSMIELNVNSVVQLTKFFLNDMLRAGGGKILFVASVAGLSGSPYLCAYGATKAFVFNFAMGLREEVKDRGVCVTALIPSETDTNFFERARMGQSKIMQSDMADPAEVAKDGYEALMDGEAFVSSPLKAKIIQAISGILPETVKSKMAKKQQEPISESH